MKKFSITLLALALAFVFTVPAMAIHVGEADGPEGSLGITGRYQFDGEARDIDGEKKDFYDDDLDLSITMTKGDVKAWVGLEIADTNPWEGNGNKAPVDGYYVDWSAMDNLNVKIGEYGLAFARGIGTDAAGARNIQATYSMDALSISGAIIVENDGANGSGIEANGIAAVAASPAAGTAAVAYAGTIINRDASDDNNTLYLKLSAKEAGPFTKLDLVSYTQMNTIQNAQADSTTGLYVDLPESAENSYLGVDLALPIGPVGLAFEYGANGGDLDGTFMLAEIGLGDLVGFDLGINYFTSSDDYLKSYDANAWSPGMILGDQINEDVLDMTIIWVDASYAVNDKLSVNGMAVVSAENDAGDAYGTEINVGLKYKIADNISYAASYGTYSEGDGVAIPAQTTTPGSNTKNPDVDTTEMFHRIEFKF